MAARRKVPKRKANRATKQEVRARARPSLDEALRAIRALRESSDRPQDPVLMPHLAPLERLLSEEAGGDPYPMILETICGATDDSQPVEQYDGTLGVTVAFVSNHERAVAQVQWNNNLAAIYTNPGNVSGVRWGTGTMIGPDLFLTAGHLFDQTGGGWNRPRVNGTTNIISSQEIATNMHLNFNYQVDAGGALEAEVSFPILQLLEYRLNGVDFAVCRIGGSPGNTYGWAGVSNVDAAVNDTLCIIGHPAGQPKRIEAGPCTTLNGNEIRYNDIDTLGGNSGSGILHDTSGQVVGVHTNGGCNAAGTGSNFGMRITAIRNASPAIQGLATATTILADVSTTPAADIGGVFTRILTDVQPTRPWIDKPVWDDFGTSIARDLNVNKRIDDVKAAGYDKQWDDPWVFDPRFRDFGRSASAGGRPFVLATGHHSPVLGGRPLGGSTAFEYEGALEQLEAMLQQSQQLLVHLASQLQSLHAAQGGQTGGESPG